MSFQEPSGEAEKPSYDDPSEIKDTVYNSEYLDLPKVDVVVPSKSPVMLPSTNLTEENLDTFCDRIELDSNEQILQGFYKV